MVQTFLPFSDFRKSASALDGKRLSKQITEAKQIIDTILEGGARARGYARHPAVLMWSDHVILLKHYHNIMIEEAISRSYKPRIKYEITGEELAAQPQPWWLGYDVYHYSHQAMLISKDSDFYQPKFELPAIYLGLGYFWPSKHNPSCIGKDPTTLLEKAKEVKYCISYFKNGKKCHYKAKVGEYCGVHEPKR